jgi:hypothetical protein
MSTTTNQQMQQDARRNLKEVIAEMRLTKSEIIRLMQKEQRLQGEMLGMIDEIFLCDMVASVPEVTPEVGIPNERSNTKGD